ncbi:MAG TPA: transcriptional regulator GcvA [Usitatibacter sp.]|nr:transcriptional regulator GcvA [Usitatibacter sp.]
MAKGNGRFPPLNALRAFEAAARHSSFKIAAKELHVTPGAVSHQVKLLEEHLGVQLFRRLTRALELTTEAHAMLPKVREGLDALQAAVERVRRRVEMASLTVVTPPNFAARWLMPRLSGFTRAHPKIELHLAARQSMVDVHENGSFVIPEADARADSPAVMVRFGGGHYPGSHVDEVFSAVYVPVCSPRLLEGEHPLRKPDDLRYHTLLHDDTVIEEGARPSWNDWLQSVGVTDIDATRGPHFSNAALAMDAAIEGMGVTLAIKSLVTSEIETHRLAVPFDIRAPTGYAYYLVSPESAVENRAVSAFREWLLDESKEERVIAIRSAGSAPTAPRR